ncbi:MAG: sulfoxide reductase heme-binding subunit YedZ [Gemmatimonadota bacterium]|nr:sulfoxide reductase heme-binding subunit YedZ [Gemmatimonadota bacterium]
MLKPVAFVASLLPALLLLVAVFTDGLGANPVESVTHRTGFAALSLLMVTLAVTPVQRLTRFSPLIQLRRMLGLFAFFYASLHFLTYAVDQTYLSGLGFSPSVIAEDVRERPYVTVGFTAFVLLLPLAVTSTKGWIKRLGGKRWRRLHRLVYVSAIGAVLHFLWLVKADLLRPVIFAGVLAILLGSRLARFRFRRSGVVRADTASSKAV